MTNNMIIDYINFMFRLFHTVGMDTHTFAYNNQENYMSHIIDDG